MAVNNIFQMLAQQEIDKPARRLQDLQIKQQEAQAQSALDAQKYQQGFQTAMQQPSLAALGTPPADGMGPMQQEIKPPSLLDGFQRQYNYHKQQGREDYAQKVLQDQMEFTLKVADFADKIHKQQGPEGVAAWMKSNPEISSVLGDMSTIKAHKDGVWYPVTKNDSNEVIPGKYWSYDGKGGIQMHEDKPQQLQTIAPGYGVADGKGGFTVPVPTAPKNEYKDRTRPDGTGTVFETSQDGGKTWTVVSRGAKAASGKAGGGAGGKGGAQGGKPLPAGTLSDLNEASQMVKTLKEAQGLAAGVDTGPVIGRLQSLGQKFGMASGDFTQMKQKIASVNNAMLKLRSGAAVTESEYQRFLNEMPTENDQEGVRDTKFANAIAYMDSLLQGKIETFAEGGYKVPSGVTGRSQPTAAKKGNDKRPPLSAIFGTKKR